MSQSNQILEYLREGNSITPLSALQLFGCFRLGARIFDLKHSGHKIKEEDVRMDGKRFAKYFLDKMPVEA